MKFGKIKVILSMLVVIAAMSMAGCNNKAKENQEAYKTIGINNMEQGNYNDAIAAFQSALDQSLAVVGPEEVDICFYKAMAQYKSGNTEDALATYTALLTYDKKNADAYVLRGNLYLDQGDEAKAFEDYKEAVANDSKNLELYISIYENLTGAGYEQDGLEIVKQAVEVTGSKANDYARRGRAYTLLGEYSDAETELDKAIEGESTEALLYKGQLLEAQEIGRASCRERV